ncbi:transmembrane channel-like protein 7 [Lineus longissimus]|uniref:transmembrane channel-like protein 7 n=1 Tax=Lineus longissimus TaxID=88925 RepID=UPI002B4C3E8D
MYEQMEFSHPGVMYHAPGVRKLGTVQPPFQDRRRKKSSRPAGSCEIHLAFLKRRRPFELTAQFRTKLLTTQDLDADLSTKRREQKEKLKREWRNFLARLEVWGGTFKRIEGSFGTAVTSYFVFLKELFFLNLWIFLLVFCFMVIPQLIWPPTDYQDTTLYDSTDSVVNQSATCSASYSTGIYTQIDYTDYGQLLLDFLQGTGWMEYTLLFYGYFANRELNIASGFIYNMPLAYILVTAVAFIISLIIMAKVTGNSFRQNVATDHDRSQPYCNIIFTGWDYTTTDENTASLKATGIYHEIVSDLDDDRHALRRLKRTKWDKCRLYTLRIFINFVVLVLLGGAGYLIYWVSDKSLQLTQEVNYKTWHKMLQLLIEYLVSLTITALNAVLPPVFTKVVKWEDYTPDFAIKLTLIRRVFLRLASLAVLVGTLYVQIACEGKDSCNSGGTGDACATTLCWETYVGQNFYKLVILDFLVVVCLIVFVEFPRRLIVTKCSCKLAKIIGQQEFDLPKNVLDLVYSQSLYWVGFFFSPLIPAMAVLKTFLVFYLKKMTCLFNYIPAEKPYKTSRSNTFFMIVLIVAYIICVFPVGYSIASLSPSRGCGPFRIYNHMHDILTETVASWPSGASATINLITSTGFLIPITVIVALVLYYYVVMVDAYKIRNKLLTEQVALEGKDKQFLLARISDLTGEKGPPKRPRQQMTAIVADTADRRPRGIAPLAVAEDITSSREATKPTPPNAVDDYFG